MANTWLRLWHDMPNDPKWRTIARASKQTIPAVMAVYVHVLVDASANASERGQTQSINCEDIASALDLETEQVELILAAMQGRVLEGNQVSGWDKRQPVKEDGAAERARLWRETKKAEKEAAERDRTQPNAEERPDKDKDTDKEESRALPAAVASAHGADKNLPVPAKPKPKRKTAMPEQFLLSPDMAKWARERAPAASLNLETEKFVNHYRGKGETRADWVASWRTWMLNAQTYATNRSKNQPPATEPNDTAWAENMGDML